MCLMQRGSNLGRLTNERAISCSNAQGIAAILAELCDHVQGNALDGNRGSDSRGVFDFVRLFHENRNDVCQEGWTILHHPCPVCLAAKHVNEGKIVTGYEGLPEATGIGVVELNCQASKIRNAQGASNSSWRVGEILQDRRVCDGLAILQI